MENQQERLQEKPLAIDLAWLAGAWESDGCISLQNNTVRVKRMNRGYDQYTPICQFTNTDTEIMLAVIDVIRRLQVGYHQYWRVNNGYQSKKLKGQIAVAGIKRVDKFLGYLLPYLRGLKKYRAKLVYEFCEERLSRPKGSKYSAKEISIFNKLQSYNQEMEDRLNLVKSSETNMLNADFVEDAEMKEAVEIGLLKFRESKISEDRVQSASKVAEG